MKFPSVSRRLSTLTLRERTGCCTQAGSIRLDMESHSFEDRAPKIRELMRQSWYAGGAQRARLVEIIENYRIELIENHVVVSRKPAESARQDDLF